MTLPGEHMAKELNRGLGRGALALVTVCIFVAAGSISFGAGEDDEAIAFHLAELLRSARSVISQNQGVINDPAVGDKGLTGEKVLADALVAYKERTGEDPAALDPNGREGQLLQAQMQAIAEVMAENQDTINAPGVGFKGFIPATFARLVNERFEQLAGDVAQIKVTAPENLIRNRKARPDEWEAAVINDRFSSPDWTKGDAFSEVTTMNDRPAFRLLVPEYYQASCLACHGEPAGEVDITGYPKEGGHEGDLGAAISITLFQ
jgi:hypothetical protein